MTLPAWETLIFPNLWGKDRISDMRSIHIRIRPPWTNVFMNQHKFAVVPSIMGQPFTNLYVNSITNCYPLEMNVHDGHNTVSLQRGIVFHDRPNDPALNKLITTEHMIIGISQIYQI